jgi:protein-S-isoprenylcysteine O-methyltransferase Ste14
MRDRLFVTGQMLLLAALVVLPWFVDSPGWTSAVTRVVGYLLVALGLLGVAAGALHLGDALTATPTPRHGSTLSTGGLYAFVRHPIYTAVLALGWGLGLRSGLWLGLLLSAALTLLLNAKARYEESLLVGHHPGYAAYAARTPRFVPRLRRRGS